MGKKELRTFIHEYYQYDMDDNSYYLIIVELVNQIPKTSYIIKGVEPFLRCPINPYIRN